MEPRNIPVLALRGLTVFPHMSLSFDVERRISIRALERAMETDQEIFLVTQREISSADSAHVAKRRTCDGGRALQGTAPAAVADKSFPAGECGRA